jgi:hypothetical protein
MAKYAVPCVILICTVLFEVFPPFFIQMFGADGELNTQFIVTP